jgi:hypothetical protein
MRYDFQVMIPQFFISIFILETVFGMANYNHFSITYYGDGKEMPVRKYLNFLLYKKQQVHYFKGAWPNESYDMP